MKNTHEANEKFIALTKQIIVHRRPLLPPFWRNMGQSPPPLPCRKIRGDRPLRRGHDLSPRHVFHDRIEMCREEVRQRFCSNQVILRGPCQSLGMFCHSSPTSRNVHQMDQPSWNSLPSRLLYKGMTAKD